MAEAYVRRSRRTPAEEGAMYDHVIVGAGSAGCVLRAEVAPGVAIGTEG
jgi:hypothetical protein